MKLPFPDYCLDTSALIDLNRQYPCDVFRSLWEDLEQLISACRVVAPQEVFEELCPKDDALLAWAKKHKYLFVELTEQQAQIVTDILKKFPTLIDPTKTIADADPFVIAVARWGQCAVVTSERPGSSNRPKIPDVCNYYRIRCISLVEFFREQRWEY